MTSVNTIIVESKKIFDEAKARINSFSYIECGKCGAIKVDTQEAVRALSILYDLYNNEEDESQQSIRDLIDSWIGTITESEPEFDSIPDWGKWDKENAHRKCDTLKWRDDIAIYTSYPEVVLRFDVECSCFGSENNGSAMPSSKLHHSFSKEKAGQEPNKDPYYIVKDKRGIRPEE